MNMYVQQYNELINIAHRSPIRKAFPYFHPLFPTIKPFLYAIYFLTLHPMYTNLLDHPTIWDLVKGLAKVSVDNVYHLVNSESLCVGMGSGPTIAESCLSGEAVRCVGNTWEVCEVVECQA